MYSRASHKNDGWRLCLTLINGFCGDSGGSLLLAFFLKWSMRAFISPGRRRSLIHFSDSLISISKSRSITFFPRSNWIMIACRLSIGHPIHLLPVTFLGFRQNGICTDRRIIIMPPMIVGLRWIESSLSCGWTWTSRVVSIVILIIKWPVEIKSSSNWRQMVILLLRTEPIKNLLLALSQAYQKPLAETINAGLAEGFCSFGYYTKLLGSQTHQNRSQILARHTLDSRRN